MKRFYLVRHAKSSWTQPSLNDHDRTLDDWGNKDAKIMAKLIMHEYGVPDLIHSSTAKRALETAVHFANCFNLPLEQLKKDKGLYLCDIEDIITTLTQLKESINSVMIFGHNPGITYFANVICEANIYDVPTCGVLIIDVNVDQWSNLDASLFKFVAFRKPKQ